MNRPDPLHPTPGPSPQDAAVRRLLADLGRQLAAEESRLEAPGFDELVAAAEGTLDEPARSLWEERVARSPQLAARAAALAEFRAAQPPSGRLLRFPERWIESNGFGWAAAAAALLVALLLAWQTPPPAAAPVSAAVETPQSEQVVFADGFESGTLVDWSITAPSG